MLQAGEPSLILASGSAARLAVLRAAGLEVQVRPASVDEAAVKASARAEGATTEQAALRLATLKAVAIARTAPDAWVIGADQLLDCDGAWFDKPHDLPAAREQLRRLRGHSHRLVTAVVCQQGELSRWQHVAIPVLAMRNFSDDFLECYLTAEGATLLGCVGAYRIEGLGCHLFDTVQGEHAAILGLPLLALLQHLRAAGVILR